MSRFKFELGSIVLLATSLPAVLQKIEDDKEDKQTLLSGFTFARLRSHLGPIEGGTVIGRAEYSEAENSYFVRYRGGDGRQVESWIGEKGLAFDPREPVKNADAAEEFSGYVAADEYAAPTPAVPESVTDTEVEGQAITISHTYGDGSNRFITIPLA